MGYLTGHSYFIFKSQCLRLVCCKCSIKDVGNKYHIIVILVSEEATNPTEYQSWHIEGFQVNWPQCTYQITTFLWAVSPELFRSGGILAIASLTLFNVWLTRLHEASQSPRAEPQHWHESMCTMAGFSSVAHTTAQCPDTCRRSSCCFLTFSHTPALHHWLCVLYIHTHSCKFMPHASQLMSVLRVSSALGWLSQVLLATNFLRFQRKAQTSLHCNLAHETGQWNVCGCKRG